MVDVKSIDDDLMEVEVDVVLGGGGTVPLNIQEHALEILDGNAEQALLMPIGVGPSDRRCKVRRRLWRVRQGLSEHLDSCSIPIISLGLEWSTNYYTYVIAYQRFCGGGSCCCS